MSVKGQSTVARGDDDINWSNKHIERNILLQGLIEYYTRRDIWFIESNEINDTMPCELNKQANEFQEL